MRIADIEIGSIAEELGICPGDELIAFDGHNVTDVLDYNYYNECENFVMTVRHGDEIIDYEIEKYLDEELGLVLDEELGTRVCRNKCIFCFVDQLPKRELRNTLRVKDDDYRLSFISGNYVTLTNDSNSDLERIVRLKLSPLYISVHTADLSLRRKMLGNPKAPDILKQLRYLKEGGIRMHAQIVYCPDINEDIAETAVAVAPYCESLAVVPVGLTKDCNTALRAVEKEDAQRVIAAITPIQEAMLQSRNTRFVFLADEFYVKAEQDVPPYECYEDFSQLENGIGLIAAFRHDFESSLRDVEFAEIGHICIATGCSAYPIIKWAADKLTDKFGGRISVYAIRNDFFGNSVTVAGLVTGGDIYRQLKDLDIGEKLILPKCMFKEFQDVFLDDMPVSELSRKLGVPIKIINTDGESFVKGCTQHE